jgi:hypothetical protein
MSHGSMEIRTPTSGEVKINLNFNKSYAKIMINIKIVDERVFFIYV